MLGPDARWLLSTQAQAPDSESQTPGSSHLNSCWLRRPRCRHVTSTRLLLLQRESGIFGLSTGTAVSGAHRPVHLFQRHGQ